MFDELKDRIVWTKPSNPSEIPTIKSIKYDPHDCEDCGRTLCESRHIEYRFNETNNVWWTKCANCNKWENPETGEYDCSATERNAIYKRLNTKPAK